MPVISPKIISVRDNHQYAPKAVSYLQSKWPDVPPIIYKDCISNCLGADSPLPQWYLLELNGAIIGCSGLVANDFISRQDLYPWFCALFVDERYRGRAYGALLLENSKRACVELGFPNVYLSTEHIGYYEKYGFHYIAQGYHPWGEESRIYGCSTRSEI